MHRRSRFDLLNQDRSRPFSPQEPRRPRFSFFLLHTVKEPTPRPTQRLKRRRKPKLPNAKEQNSPPVSRQQPRPLQIGSPNTGRSQKLLNLASDTRDIRPAHKPVNTPPPNFQISLVFQQVRWSSKRLATTRVASGSADIRTSFSPVNSGLLHVQQRRWALLRRADAPPARAVGVSGISPARRRDPPGKKATPEGTAVKQGA